MIRASDIITRLKADAGVAALVKAIDPGSDIPSALDQLQTYPALFVDEGLTERAQPSDTATMVTRQRAEAFFVVLLLVRQIGATGTEQDGEIVTIREAVKNALIGWTPNSEQSNPVSYGGARIDVVDTQNDALAYVINFSSSYEIRKVNSP